MPNPWKPKAPPDASVKVPAWDEKELIRKVTEWSTHMYKWGQDVKEKVDKNTKVCEPLGDPSNLDPPPKPPFGGD